MDDVDGVCRVRGFFPSFQDEQGAGNLVPWQRVWSSEREWWMAFAGISLSEIGRDLLMMNPFNASGHIAENRYIKIDLLYFRRRILFRILF